eukprot:7211483-Pyramimonas_sp.AAC.1
MSVGAATSAAPPPAASPPPAPGAGGASGWSRRWGTSEAADSLPGLPPVAAARAAASGRARGEG